MAEKLKIPVRGQATSYKISSVRLKTETWAALNAMAAKTNRSCNEVIAILLQYGLKNADVGQEPNHSAPTADI